MRAIGDLGLGLTLIRAREPGRCPRKQHGSRPATPEAVLAWSLLIETQLEVVIPDGADIGGVEASLAQQLHVGDACPDLETGTRLELLHVDPHLPALVRAGKDEEGRSHRVNRP